MSPELNSPVSDVHVWASGSWLVTVTVVPTAMTRGEGRYAKFRIARVAAFGTVVVVGGAVAVVVGEAVRGAVTGGDVASVGVVDAVGDGPAFVEVVGDGPAPPEAVGAGCAAFTLGLDRVVVVVVVVVVVFLWAPVLEDAWIAGFRWVPPCVYGKWVLM